MKILVATLALTISSAAFALPVFPHPQPSPEPTGGIAQMYFSCSEPNCEYAIETEVNKVCQEKGMNRGYVLDANVSGAPTTQCFHPKGSFPFCITSIPYSVTYQCF